MTDISAWLSRLGTSTCDTPLIPAWVREWGYFIIILGTSITMMVAGVTGEAYGEVAAWAMLLIPGFGSAVLWGAGYARRQKTARVRTERELLERLEVSKLHDLTPDEFEQVYCPDLLRARGYTDVEFVGRTKNKQEVDIIATDPDGVTPVAVECKHRKDKTGPDVPRHLAGVLLSGPYKGRKGIVMSSNLATDGAKAAAKARGITMADRPVLVEWASESLPRLEQSSREPQPAPPAVRALVVASCAAVMLPFVMLFVQPWRTSPVASDKRADSSTVVLPTSPAATVSAYYAAISQHDWRRVWQLGGKNLERGPSATYNGMVAGYRPTLRDVVKAIHVSGDSVSGWFLAYQTNGTLAYSFRYTVHNGFIASGQAARIQDPHR